MFVFLSKVLPNFIYPVGLAFVLVLVGLLAARHRKAQRILLVSALLVLWLAGSGWAADALVRSLEWQYLPLENPPPAEVIVLLGGGTLPDDPPRSTVELNGAGDRVLHAARLYRQGLAPAILVSGSYIEWQVSTSSTPTQEMKTLLVFMGVPEEAIWLEDRSVNTYENALYCKQILEEKSINRVLLVTSAMHMPRSVALFEAQGLEVIPMPTDFSSTVSSPAKTWTAALRAILTGLVPSAENLNATTLALKEYLGILVYRLQGWL